MPVVREVVRNVYVDRPVPVPTVRKVVEPYAVPVVKNVVEPYAVPVVNKVVEPYPVPVVNQVVEPYPVPVVSKSYAQPVVGIKGPAFESFQQSLQQKLDDFKSSS